MSFSASVSVAGLMLLLPLAACVPLSDLAHAESPQPQRLPVAVMPEAPDAPAVVNFVEERAMGADCGPAAITDAPLEDMACSGHLPEYFASFLRNIPNGHPFLSGHEKNQLSHSKHSFKLVEGLGARPDILVVIHHYRPFWIRSFEGPDPDVTVYLAYGPECAAPLPGSGRLSEPECRPEGAYLRDFTLYRVDKGGVPKDVTAELAPPAPRLAGDEGRRYGRYVRATGDAVDGDIQLDISRLAYVPALRWVLRPVQEGEYTPPGMPSSDARAFKDDYWGTGNVAHFGFLVWNGRRMASRERVPSALWPCRSSGLPTCDQGYESSADRYLD
ncbi:hypothetical protein [Pseudoxanthomonas sp. PXM02]|uniref:hypothetical protein n=1 Tax=Pseudoxanthomonas sp. PXM02 TaxID=2769294 RepID=UPI0017846ABE|nr:hypothetical protein [Pseudoxanthomonas sp. PXM02]MBD9478396.1 hypothetical protein [Pseudoxanthomonas sp. PXM02]